MSVRPTAARRDFLKAAAASAGAAATVNLAGAFAAGNEVTKVGLIGCGGRGTGAVRNILDAEAVLNPQAPKVEIVAVGDVFKERARAAADQFRAVDQKDPNKKDEKSPFFKYAAQVKLTPETTFDGLDAYEKVLNAGVDLVILATPPGFRPQHLEAAVRAGKHVFCEKPVAVDAAGIRKCFGLVDESKKRNLAIVAGTQRRHQKGYIETVKKLHDGAIGGVKAARCAWNNNGIWFNARKPGEKDAAYQLRNWYHFLWLCGDHIVEQHVHNLDVVNWVMQDHPVKAVGLGGRAARPVGEPAEVGQIWDHFAVEYEYKNGVKLFSYCRHIPGETDVSETIVGTKGNCRVDQYRIGREEVGSDDRDPYVQEHIDLLNSIRAGRPLNELRGVTESTFTAILGRNAAYACKTLKWDDALAADDATMPKELTLESSIEVTPAPTPGSWKLPARRA
ncbi:MAG: Gfo/Idh/MocA family oxidoreductase [Gemmataceae bacterium]|nr:Gfo/Idh/MocA family oxidoreductase [Gemmataceae bacterium]